MGVWPVPFVFCRMKQSFYNLVFYSNYAGLLKIYKLLILVISTYGFEKYSLEKIELTNYKLFNHAGIYHRAVALVCVGANYWINSTSSSCFWE
jgi:hypothetical protein